MIDRRKNPREFFVAGWDPYIIRLTAEGRTPHKTSTVETVPTEPVVTRWRSMVAQRLGMA